MIFKDLLRSLEDFEGAPEDSYGHLRPSSGPVEDSSEILRTLKDLSMPHQDLSRTFGAPRPSAEVLEGGSVEQEGGGLTRVEPRDVVDPPRHVVQHRGVFHAQ